MSLRMRGKRPSNWSDLKARNGQTLEEIYGQDKALEIRGKLRLRPKPTKESNDRRRESCILAGCGYSNKGKTRSNKTRSKMRNNMIERLALTMKNFHPPFNKMGCLYFDELMKKTGVHIQHALNGGEYFIKELGFWVDGYGQANNIVYEFDELRRHYKNGVLVEKDVVRQKLIEDLLKCRFVRIKETDSKIIG
jgi:hypothetical protein